MADNEAQQIMVSDAYRPQGSVWQSSQQEHPAESAGYNPYTMGLDVEPESADWRSFLDIVRLLLFAVLLRMAETVAIDDTPGWWKGDE